MASVLALLVFLASDPLPVNAGSSADQDADGVADTSDRCPAKPGEGSISGCPRLYGAYGATWHAQGRRLVVDTLSVTASRGADVTITCSGTCPRQQIVVRGTGRAQDLPEFTGRPLRRGTQLVMRVTSPGSIGAYLLALVRRTYLDRTRLCLEPGAQEPREDCTGTDSSPTAEDSDGDAVPNTADICPATHGGGMVSGCPPIQLTSTFFGTPDPSEQDELRLSQFKIVTQPGAYLDVQCSRSTTCPPELSLVTESGTARLPGYGGLLVPLGTVIELRATKPGSVGAYRRFTARAAGLVSTVKCLNPGAWSPAVSCDAFPVGEPPPRLTPWLDPFPSVRFQGGHVGARTFVRKLTAQHLERGVRIDVACHGGGCPFRSRRGVRARRGVIPRIARSILQPGSRITVDITKPGRIGLHTTFRSVRRGAPERHEACLLSRSRGPRPCPPRP